MLGIAVPASLAGCQESAAPAPAVAVAVEAAPAPVEPPAEKELGEFHLTFYYVIGEDEAEQLARRHEAAHAAAEGGTPPDPTVLAAVDPAAEPELVTLYNGRDCAPIAEVTPGFAAAVALQGTGKLRDGRVINVYGKGRCKCGPAPRRCYSVTGRKWGNAGNGRALDPFRTVAVDPRQVKLGSMLYIPALDGLTMPGRAPVGGWKHDGCVSADDTGGGIDGKQLDLFVARHSFYIGLARRGGSHSWSKHVRVLDGAQRCERTNGRVHALKSAAI